MRRSSSSKFSFFASALALGAALGTLGFVSTAAAQAAPATAKKPGATPALQPTKPPDKKTREAARNAYSGAEKAYAGGNYSAAYDGYKKAFDLIPTPHAEYWMAKSLDQAGKAQEAIHAYSDFLADPAASKVGDDKVADARDRLAALRAKQPGELNVTTVPAGATIAVDGTPEMGETPMALKLSSGTHRLTVSARGYETREIDVDVKGGERADQQIELVAKPPPPPEPPPAVEPVPAPVAPPPAPPKPIEKHSKVPAYVTLGIASAGAIVGTIFGIQALSSKSDFNDHPTTKNADDTERNALIADMAFGVAITLGVTGIVLLTSGDDTAQAGQLERLPRKASLRFAPYVSPTGGGAAARLTF